MTVALSAGDVARDVAHGVRQALHLPFWVGQGTVGLLVLSVWVLFGLSPYTLVLSLPLLLIGQLHHRHWLRGEVGIGLKQAMTKGLQPAVRRTARQAPKPRAVPIIYQPQPNRVVPAPAMALAMPGGGTAIRLDGFRETGLKPARQRPVRRSKVPHAD